MFKILQDKIKHIYLIQYLTFQIVSRLTETIINIIFWLPVFNTEKGTTLYYWALWIWINQWVMAWSFSLFFLFFFLLPYFLTGVPLSMKNK